MIARNPMPNWPSIKNVKPQRERLPMPRCINPQVPVISAVQPTAKIKAARWGALVPKDMGVAYAMIIQGVEKPTVIHSGIAKRTSALGSLGDGDRDGFMSEAPWP